MLFVRVKEKARTVPGFALDVDRGASRWQRPKTQGLILLAEIPVTAVALDNPAGSGLGFLRSPYRFTSPILGVDPFDFHKKIVEGMNEGSPAACGCGALGSHFHQMVSGWDFYMVTHKICRRKSKMPG
jgi:hypothetical protein